MKVWEEEWGISGYGELTRREPDASLPKGEVYVPWAESVRPTSTNLARVQLAHAAPDMARALLAVEWSGPDPFQAGGGGCCPACSAIGADGRHRSNCAIDAALRKAGVRGSNEPTTTTPDASPCQVYARSSAVCSLGTRGCPLHHG